MENYKQELENPRQFIVDTVLRIQQGEKNRLKAVWLETSECFGEVISLLNAEEPDILYWLTQMVDCTFFNSIMGNQGEAAMEELMETIESGQEYLFITSGAIPLAEEGNCAIVGTYQGKDLTSMELVSRIAEKASTIVAVGTCACFGGPTAAAPNITQAVSVADYLQREVINVPGCPVHPVWLLGVFAYLVNFGRPELDEEGRPVAFYGQTIHMHCPRRSYFSNQDFATKFGEKECMIALGCKGPVTKTLCPYTRWNDTDNWPIGDNTTCIGCANKGFPDQMQPFVKYANMEEDHGEQNN